MAGTDQTVPGETRLYTELAAWFHLLTAPADYREEADFYARTLADAVGPVRAVLELGSGGGNTASHLTTRFAMTLTDLSPAMLELSRTINPRCEHIQGDMRSLTLGRSFDAVLVHDAVAYMTTREDLLRAARTAFAHCRPGGAALFCPDQTREHFQPSANHGGHDEVGSLRGLRYLEWTWDPDPSDTRYRCDFALLLRDESGAMRCVEDRHELGLFSCADWMATLAEAGFTPRAVPFIHSEAMPGATIFLGLRSP